MGLAGHSPENVADQVLTGHSSFAKQLVVPTRTGPIVSPKAAVARVESGQ